MKCQPATFFIFLICLVGHTCCALPQVDLPVAVKPGYALVACSSVLCFMGRCKQASAFYQADRKPCELHRQRDFNNASKVVAVAQGMNAIGNLLQRGRIGVRSADGADGLLLSRSTTDLSIGSVGTVKPLTGDKRIVWYLLAAAELLTANLGAISTPLHINLDVESLGQLGHELASVGLRLLDGRKVTRREQLLYACGIALRIASITEHAFQEYIPCEFCRESTSVDAMLKHHVRDNIEHFICCRSCALEIKNYDVSEQYFACPCLECRRWLPRAALRSPSSVIEGGIDNSVLKAKSFVKREDLDADAIRTAQLGELPEP